MRTYLELSKSGIVTLVIISVLGGFLAGHPFESPLNWTRLLLTLIGVFGLAAGSSALNQIQEVEIDQKMARTAKRPLASGKMTKKHALTFVFICLTIGLGVLSTLSTKLVAIGVLAILSYNGLYTLWWKKHWSFAAVPGAIPGALPILMGYVAASDKLWAPQGWYFFFLLFFWQMPHFWALSIRFKDDYAQGGFPTLSVSHGEVVTRFHILYWCLAYIGIALSGTLFLRTHWINFGCTLVMSTIIAWQLFKFMKTPDAPKAWLKFFLWVNFSLIIYIFGAVADLYSVYAIAWITQ